MTTNYAEQYRLTYGEQDEDDVLNDVSTSIVANSHQCTPASPVFALRHAVFAPATKRFVQVEFASIVNITADTGLEVSHPVTRNVDACRNTTNSDTRRDEDQPYLTGVRKHSQLSKDTRSVCQEML